MTIQELNEFVNERIDLTLKLNKKFKNNITDEQTNLFNLIQDEFIDKLQIENGKVINNSHNRKILISIDEIFKDYIKDNRKKIVSLLNIGLNQIIWFNLRYYNKLTKSSLVKIDKQVKDFIYSWLGVKDHTIQKGGYMYNIVNKEIIKNTIKDFSMQTILKQSEIKDSRKNLDTLINGNDKKIGIVEKFHHTNTSDFFSEVDRAVSEVYRNELNLEYAIYAGNIIKTSRIFCREHVNKVYHISEIREFNPKEAKQPDYNPIYDLGGYGCRHTLNWISKDLAKLYRPEIK